MGHYPDSLESTPVGHQIGESDRSRQPYSLAVNLNGRPDRPQWRVTGLRVVPRKGAGVKLLGTLRLRAKQQLAYARDQLLGCKWLGEHRTR